MSSRTGPTLVGTVIFALALAALLLIAACSDEDATPGSGRDEAADQSPTLEAFVPTPSPAPTVAPSATPIPTPTPASFSVSVPLPPTATPRPTATPDPEASAKYIEELLTLVEDELPTTRIGHQALTLRDGRVVFIGGTLPTVGNQGLFFGGPHPFVEIYDPATDSWSLEDPIMPLLGFVKAVKLADGSILILGIEETQAETEALPIAAYILDGETLEPTRVSSPTAPRASPDLVLMDDGRVAAIGGIDALSESSIFDVPVSLAVEIYDPALDVWVDAAAQPGGLDREFNFWGQDEISQWVFPLGGSRVLTVRVGEISDDEDSALDDVVRIDSFDATTNAWETLATLHMWISDLPWHATASADGTVNIVYANRIESFNPSNGEWSISYAPDSVILTNPEREESNTFERQALPRNASITELPDGRFLVAGGERGGYSSLPRSTTIVYDPATNLWMLGPELVEPRVSHSVTVLNNGSVMLFGGFTIWEENEDEGIPTNSMEIITAARIAAVDTVTIPTTSDGRPNPPIDYPCWNAASAPAQLPIVTDAHGELPEARQLLTKSLDEMNKVKSFATISLWFNYTGMPGLENMDARDTGCSYRSSEYEAPDNLSTESLWFQNRSFNGGGTTVIADRTYYTYLQSEELWKLGRQAEDDDIQRFLLILPPETLDDTAIEWATVAIEELNGVDVYHVRGDKTENDEHGQSIYSFHYWVGVDDYLVHRTYEHINSPDYNMAEIRQQTYALTEVSRFGAVFNIQAPITPEEAARPEASGEQRCRDIEDLEPLQQATVSGGSVLKSASDIIMRATQAMDSVSSYATLHLSLGYQQSKDPENILRLGGDCRYRQTKVSGPDRLSSRDILFGYPHIESDEYRIVIGQKEYMRQSRDGEWTFSELDAATVFTWPHTEYMPAADGASGRDLQLVGIESLDGDAVYHVLEQDDGSEEGSERTFSVWIGVDDFLLRRVSIVTRMDDPDQTTIGGGAVTVIHRLIEFHSFDADFNIQPPPDDEIAK